MEKPNTSAFDRLRERFLRLRELDAGQRRARLDRLAADEPDTARLLEGMLDADASEQRSVIDLPLLRLGSLVPADRSSCAGLPERIGQWRVVELIGCGSMGDVYLAERPGTRAAVKVFRPGLVSRGAAARVRREARALAALSHPNIARILDADLTPEGRPYLAVEHVRGDRVDRFCIERDLPVQHRLGLMLQLCAGVQHAHQRGVIHRDLKPANVLVDDSPDGPAVKIIDFGVAKLTEAFGEPVTAMTLHGQFVGTIGYMSPEQRHGREVDARADVYAIGVLLHRVLTERMPGDRDRTAPSLPHDLALIVAKATHEDAHERYPTPAHVADDLGRYLRSEPIAARPPSPLYLARRFAGRNPASVALGAVLLVAGLLLAGQYVDAQRRLAEEHNTQRELLIGVLDSTLEALSFLSGAGEPRRELAFSLLDRTEALLAITPDDPRLLEARARLIQAIGDFEYEDGRVEEGLRLRTEAMDALGALADADPNNIPLQRRHHTAVIKVGDVWNNRRDTERALAYFEHAHERIKNLLAAVGEHPGLMNDFCWSHERLGAIKRATGRTREAMIHVRTRLVLAERMIEEGERDHYLVFNLSAAHRQMADSMRRLHRWPEAERHIRHARILVNEAVAMQPSRAHYLRSQAGTVQLMAGILAESRGYGAARAVFEEAFALADRLARDNPGRADLLEYGAAFRGGAARAAFASGHTDEAIALATQALRMYERFESSGSDVIRWSAHVPDEMRGIVRMRGIAARDD